MKSKQVLRVFLLVIVIAAFVLYFMSNQDQFSKIGNLTVWEILLIIVGQAIVIVSNIFILIIVVRFITRRMSFVDAARLTAYSSLINFFGFLQGGVGFRGIYLKKHYDMSLKKYSLLTLVQYCIFFGIAGILLVTGLWLTTGIHRAVLLLILIIIGLALCVLVFSKLKSAAYMKTRERLAKIRTVIQVRPLLGIAAATLFQLSGSMLANAVELHAVGADISIGSLLIYTGVSQFAIIIALTPGAIGIRETILLLVQHQMSLTTETIIVASTIDRLVYFVTLALFAPLAIGMRRRIGAKPADS
ncbi:MAG: hypothetical protein JWM00_171 [Candidatus Saccharibacteria bacterium]|nr:hypothetical protein [Candidatus Saccharibacteria bacterium]